MVEGEEPAVAAAAEAPAAEAEAVDTEAAMSNERTRNLFYRFWLLRSSDRREIADHLVFWRKMSARFLSRSAMAGHCCGPGSGG